MTDPSGVAVRSLIRKDTIRIKADAAARTVPAKPRPGPRGETRQVWSCFLTGTVPRTRVRLDRAPWAEVSRHNAIAKAGASGIESLNS